MEMNSIAQLLIKKLINFLLKLRICGTHEQQISGRYLGYKMWIDLKLHLGARYKCVGQVGQHLTRYKLDEKRLILRIIYLTVNK